MSDTVPVVEIEWIWRDSWSGPEADGFSYHKDIATAQKYIKDYWAKMPDHTPDEYRCPNEPVVRPVNPVFALLVFGKGTIESVSRAS